VGRRRHRFWEAKQLDEMSHREWEALCDGCARCCLHKLEDEETGEIRYTNVCCRLLDIEACRCTRYEERKRLVPQCACLTPQTIGDMHWLPSTCAYRRLAAGRGLPSWHPLATGDPESTHKAGMSVRDRVVSEEEAQDVETFMLQPGRL